MNIAGSTQSDYWKI